MDKLYEPDIQDFSIVDEPKMQFILSEVKDHLEDTLKVADQLDIKSQVILTVLSTITIALIGVVVVQYSPALGCFHQNRVVTLSLLGASFYTIATIILLLALWPIRYKARGNTPKN